MCVVYLASQDAAKTLGTFVGISLRQAESAHSAITAKFEGINDMYTALC